MATTIQHITNLATRVGTEIKALRTLINGNIADLTALTFGSKTTLVAALNELKVELDSVASAGGATINDASGASTSQTWSITKISDSIATAISSVTAGAPEAMDTLDELAAALGDDANFAATITTALAARLKFDAAQALTAPQKVQGNANLGSVSLVQLGDPDTNFVDVFNAGLL